MSWLDDLFARGDGLDDFFAHGLERLPPGDHLLDLGDGQHAFAHVAHVEQAIGDDR